MTRFRVAAVAIILVACFLFGRSALAAAPPAPPAPDPAPGAHGPIHWVAYTILDPSVDGHWLYSCRISRVHGRRHEVCTIIGHRPTAEGDWWQVVTVQP